MQIDQARRAAGSLIDGIDRRIRKLHAPLALAGDAKTMRDVSGNAVARQRRQLASHRDALIDLPHLGEFHVRTQFRLTHEHHLQHLLAPLEVGQDSHLFEQRQRQVLCLVDDQHSEGL